MPEESKSPTPVISVTASKTAAAVPSKAPAIGTASADPSLKATATSGTSTSSGFAVNAGGGDVAAGFKASASNGSTATVTAESGEEEFIESVVADNAPKVDETTEPDEEGKVTVPKDVIKELLKDYEIPKDDSIKEAFRSMVANYFVFRENYAIIKKEWDDKLQNPDPSLMDRVKGVDLTPENIAKTIIQTCAEKSGLNKKSDVQDDKTTSSSPTVTPVSKVLDTANDGGTQPSVGGGTFIDKLAQKGKEFLGSLKKKIIDLTSGADPAKDQNNNTGFHSVATSDEIVQVAATKKAAVRNNGTSSQAAVNPELAGEFANQAGTMAELSRSSSDLATSSGLAAKTAKPAAEPAMLMMGQHAAAAAKSSGLPTPTTSDGLDGITIGKPVEAPPRRPS